MARSDVARSYPNLFRKATWPGGPIQVQFALLDEIPPEHLIANVNIVPWVHAGWLMIRLNDGSWEIPGGTLEPGETYLAAIERELYEEAGARLKSFRLLGGWHCISLAPKPYREHLPFPEFYRLVGVGEVELVRLPENPADGEQVIAVECASLDTVVERFVSMGRFDLAELYQLGSVLTNRDQAGDNDHRSF